jgi:hypothetical protein
MTSLAQRLGFGPTQPAAAPPALTAAAHVLRLGRDKIVPQEQSWQAEAWGYYDGRLGEFAEGVRWLSRMISRVRLVAAEVEPLADEPSPVESGPVVDLLAELGSGTDGHAQMLRALAVHFTVPGESWLTGEGTGQGREWTVRSSSEIREGKTKNARREAIPEVIDDASATSSRVRWRPLAPLDEDDWFVAKLWSRDEQYRHLASSPSKAALPDLRRLELVNRHIDSTLLSRLAIAGIWPIPNEVTFPARPEFADEPDPFVAEFIETARQAIANPGTASAVIPIPLKIPGEFLGKMDPIKFDSPLDERILDLRAALVRAIATTLDVPAEILLGLADLNHWAAWAVTEEAVRAHIAPLAELICHSLTRGFLRPLLGDGPAAGNAVIWYDLSELVQRPDRSEAARDAYDRLELSPEAYRREVGFDEDDKPSDEERKEMALLALLKTGEAGRAAEELGVLEPAPESLQPGGPRPVADEDRPADGPPGTRDAPAPSGREAPARAASANGRAK